MTDREILMYAEKNKNRRKLKHSSDEGYKIYKAVRVYKEHNNIIMAECERLGITFTDYINALIEKQIKEITL